MSERFNFVADLDRVPELYRDRARGFLHATMRAEPIGPAPEKYLSVAQRIAGERGYLRGLARILAIADEADSMASDAVHPGDVWARRMAEIETGFTGPLPVVGTVREIAVAALHAFGLEGNGDGVCITVTEDRSRIETDVVIKVRIPGQLMRTLPRFIPGSPPGISDADFDKLRWAMHAVIDEKLGKHDLSLKDAVTDAMVELRRRGLLRSP